MAEQEEILKNEAAEAAAEAKSEEVKTESTDDAGTEETATEATAEEATADAEETTQDSEEKGFFKKNKKEKAGKVDKEKEALKEQVATLDDKVKRQLAEFENFRNRTEKEKAASYDNGAAMALKKMLPILDNMERGLAVVPEDKKEDAFVQGMDKVYRQMLTELQNMGVEQIEALGKPLDPNLHNAVMQQEMEGYEPGIICQELQKGYIYHDIVLRYSMVAVVPE